MQQQQQQQASGALRHGKGARKQGGGDGRSLAAVSVSVGALHPSSSSHPASKVVHLRGLPPYATEGDVVNFFATLVGVSLTRILLLPNSNQAFMQLASVEQAQQLMSMQAAQGGHLLIKGQSHRSTSV